MDIAITIVMLVPVLLAVALIINVIRKNVTERQAGDPVDISGAIPAVIVLMVAVLIIVAMGSAASPYVYDEDSGELTIQKNVPQLDVQPWDSYASDVKSLIIEDGVTVGAGAFDSLTNLEYVSVGEGVTIGSGAFGVAFKDAMGSAVDDASGSDFAGFGDGTLYLCDPGVFTYTSGGKDISGLASGYSGARYLVIPAEQNGIRIEGIANAAFLNNSTVTAALSHPDSSMSRIGINAFSGCTSLTRMSFPTVTVADSNAFLNTALAQVSLPSATTLGSKVFSGCASLTDVELPNATSISNNAFSDCTSLTDVELVKVETISSATFSGCTALESVSLPAATSMGLNAFNGCTSLTDFSAPRMVSIGTNALRETAITEASFQLVTTLEANTFYNCLALEKVDLPAITTIGSGAFIGCAGITSVHFGSGLSSVLANSMQSWTFYGSDWTTVIDKTVAANLAGKTFEGTAAALIEVAPGQLSLTPQQLQQVQLHTQELQDLKDHLTIDPLPFQPTVQTQDQEPVSA